MSNKLLFPWIIVIETILLLLIIGTAYSSDNEAIESAVGPHLLHIVTISLLLITFINPSEDARSYARVYAWTNVAMDNIALFLMLFRYSQTETLHLGQLDAAHFTLYVVFVLVLIVIDIHNVTFTWDHDAGGAAPEPPPPAVPVRELEAAVAPKGTSEEVIASSFQAAALWTPTVAPQMNFSTFDAATNFGITRRQHPSLRFV